MRLALLTALLLTTLSARAQEAYSLKRNAVVIGLAVIEGAANATMDTIDHHWERSIFDAWPEPRRSFMRSDWEYTSARREAGWPVQLADGWHLAKTVQLTTWVTMVVVFDNRGMRWWEYVLWGVAIGTVRNLSFSLFYNHVLVR